MATEPKTGVLLAPKAPNLPIAPGEYEARFHEQFTNILRLYFNSIDNFTGALSSTSGGGSLQFPYIAAEDNGEQYATGNSVPTVVTWDTLVSGNSFTLNVDNTATAAVSGVYKIDYSLQLANTANAIHDVYVWLQVNGSLVAGSTSKFTLQARKSSGVYNYVVAYSSIVFEINAGDSFKLWWETDLAYNPVGPVDGVYMDYIPAQVSPHARPSAPSAVGSITFVSRLPT
jgi:hypothetical protein